MALGRCTTYFKSMADWRAVDRETESRIRTIGNYTHGLCTYNMDDRGTSLPQRVDLCVKTTGLNQYFAVIGCMPSSYHYRGRSISRKRNAKQNKSRDSSSHRNICLILLQSILPHLYKDHHSSGCSINYDIIGLQKNRCRRAIPPMRGSEPRSAR